MQVYGQYPVSVPVVINGCDQQSEVYTVDSPDERSQADFEKQIQQLLTENQYSPLTMAFASEANSKG